jgi:hypothetical protein
MHALRSHKLALLVVCAVAGLLWAAPVRAADIKLPTGEVVKQVDFERHIMGLFGRMGCNAGSCHGSFQGKGGFRLSLFGYEPDRDYEALTHEVLGRRINAADPDASLLLLKATGQVKHEGGRRFSKDSWAYQIIREWIAQGAPRRKGSGDIASIAIKPGEYAFAKPLQNGQLAVEATFGDGSKENITAFCDYRTNDDAIVEVDNLGKLRSIRPGDTSVIVSYRGHILPVRVMVPLEAAPGFVYPKVPEVNYIDREVFAKLRRLNMVPSDLSSDNEFLRRVYLDTIGTLPTPEEVRAFLADTKPDKRARKIDELLAHPMHAALWATKFSDITGNNTGLLENPQNMQARRSQMWHDWLRKRFADNQPYDQFVHDILCATSRDNLSVEDWIKQTNQIEEEMAKGFKTSYPERKTLDLFWRRQQVVPIDQVGEKTAVAFLGVRLECAQCHKHPFDRWTQADYRAYANLFATIKVDPNSPEAAKAIVAENNARRQALMGKPNQQLSVLRELYVSRTAGAMLPHPDTNVTLTPKALGGPEIKVEAGKDPRETLFAWMREKNNPFFARSFVNRVWGHYYGIGIVQPVDDFSLANPPSNPKLLDALAQDFIESGYDIRKLERTILLSRTYQLTSTVNETNKLDKNCFSHSYVRPLMAEVVLDLLNAGIGVEQKFTNANDAPAGVRAIEIGASRISDPATAYVFRVFGRPPRATTCDCERTAEAGLGQKLYLIADQAVKDKIDNPNNRLKKLLADHKDDNAALDELFLATQTRLPTERERAAFARFRAATPDRATAFRSALWAIVNTGEFIFNH